MKSEQSTYFANKGVPRNKKPLRNKVYLVKTVQLRDDLRGRADYVKYKYEDGYLWLDWYYEGEDIRNMHGLITPFQLKQLLGEKQYSKFRQGKREFIVQRRVNGKNVAKKNQAK